MGCRHLVILELSILSPPPASGPWDSLGLLFGRSTSVPDLHRNTRKGLEGGFIHNLDPKDTVQYIEYRWRSRLGFGCSKGVNVQT